MIALVISFIVLNLLDISTTYYALSLGYEEANKIAEYLIENNLWVVIKIVLMAIVVLGALLSRNIKIFKIIFTILFIIVNLLISIAVINNVIILMNK